MTKGSSNSIFSDMQTGSPYKTYKKTILGKVSITVLNPFDETAEGVILSGDPRTNDSNTMIDIWDEKQDMFFRRRNKSHLETGVLIPFNKPETVEEFKPEPYATSTDEDIEKVLMSKYWTLLSEVNKITSEAVMFRFINKARELEKSEKIMNTLNARLSEIQSGELDK